MPDNDWQLILCNLAGTPLMNVTQIASSRQIKYTHNRQTSVSFVVPSGDSRVADVQSDGDPALSVGTRTVKLFRREGSSYVIRANCTIETIEDAGEPDNARSTVTAYSPFYDLGRRWARDSGGAANNVVFTTTDGAQIVKTLIERTNINAGNCGIETVGATYDNVDDFSVTYAFQPIAPAIIDLCDAFNGFDFYEEPLDLTTGKQVKLHCVARRGSDRSDTIFGWGMWPHNIQSIKNFYDRSTLANYMEGLGAGSGIDLQHTGPVSDSASITKYRQLEVADSMPDVGNFFLGPLITEELAYRKVPQQKVTWVPQPGIPFGQEPFASFDIGDTIRVQAGYGLRGGFTGIQRVYGFTLSLDDNGLERVSEVITSPGGA